MEKEVMDEITILLAKIRNMHRDDPEEVFKLISALYVELSQDQ